MPLLGEIQKGKTLGKRNKWETYVWRECPDCGKQRWGQARSKTTCCAVCHCKRLGKEKVGYKNHNWKGGRRKNNGGYIIVKLYPDDFFYSMAHKTYSYILEHRLVMAQHLSRCLLPWEVVHHKNGIRDDNRIENLELLPDKRWHLVDTKTKVYITKLEKEVQSLRIKIKDLKATS